MSLLTKAVSLAATALLAGSLTAAPAQANVVEISPPGANDWSCKPTAEHPYPVILVPGTFESMVKNWSTLSPYLKSEGYCVFALNYGETNGVYATGPVAESAAELAPFVDAVRSATGAKKVNLVGHSQGGMMPRYYMGFLGGAKNVNQLIGIAPSNHGTEGLIVPPPEALEDPDFTAAGCAACADQQAGSAFMQELNSIGDTVAGSSYTVISTVYDEVVIPYNSQFLAGPAKQVTNITIQDKCPADVFEHDQTPNDPVVHQIVAHALSRTSGPADPAYQPRCI
ncbi:alpha/beta fold hydrolase [Pseudarthrobacter phenanthrenivorans]|uniref:Alpha/beta fold hydrolase n=1 Tax=Pseudarthrobacter phenanthrenivorans TaxID=361575 RepID=A0A3B0G335_PSEPS|nr:alpha/beta fold hydrolase [Pseudarthrobacter phenanthrenivorans]RKO26189.1 alpha/beta fold hydrolase [Pseudarthrobacter phenanthrenivorans]TPV48625.1 alpha/beta fold hydrolase [Pseudarthrobacter phenanthrenivorans]